MKSIRNSHRDLIIMQRCYKYSMRSQAVILFNVGDTSLIQPGLGNSGLLNEHFCCLNALSLFSLFYLKMTKFKPCIDLHQGQVKQIVGGTLDSTNLKTNFISLENSEYYAKLYQKHDLKGGHVIMLGPDNDTAALSAIKGWHDNLQLGGGVNIDNAERWISEGANKVIVTSWLFPDGIFDQNRLRRLVERIGTERLVVRRSNHKVIDLSCRENKENGWVVAINKWQNKTNYLVDAGRNVN